MLFLLSWLFPSNSSVDEELYDEFRQALYREGPVVDWAPPVLGPYLEIPDRYDQEEFFHQIERIVNLMEEKGEIAVIQGRTGSTFVVLGGEERAVYHTLKQVVNQEDFSLALSSDLMREVFRRFGSAISPRRFEKMLEDLEQKGLVDIRWSSDIERHVIQPRSSQPKPA